MQCNIVLGFSLKYMRPYPNTLPIWSFLGVKFCVFHTRDILPFLICLPWAFPFRHSFTGMMHMPYNNFKCSISTFSNNSQTTKQIFNPSRKFHNLASMLKSLFPYSDTSHNPQIINTNIHIQPNQFSNGYP